MESQRQDGLEQERHESASLKKGSTASLACGPLRDEPDGVPVATQLLLLSRSQRYHSPEDVQATLAQGLQERAIRAGYDFLGHRGAALGEDAQDFGVLANTRRNALPRVTRLGRLLLSPLQAALGRRTTPPMIAFRRGNAARASHLLVEDSLRTTMKALATTMKTPATTMRRRWRRWRDEHVLSCRETSS